MSLEGQLYNAAVGLTADLMSKVKVDLPLNMEIEKEKVIVDYINMTAEVLRAYFHYLVACEKSPAWPEPTDTTENLAARIESLLKASTSGAATEIGQKITSPVLGALAESMKSNLTGNK